VTFREPLADTVARWDSAKLGALRLRLFAQPQVQREVRRLARLRKSSQLRMTKPSDEYQSALERLAHKLRGFVSADELDAKAAKLADPDYPERYVWLMVPGIDAAECGGRDRQRAPRQAGPPFRKVVADYDVKVDGEPVRKKQWVDERIESAAKHIALGLDMRDVADGSHKPDGATERKQISRLRKLVSEDSQSTRWTA